MKTSSRTLAFLKLLQQFFIFFLLVAFVITCCTLLFVTTLTDTLGIELTAETVGAAAKLTLFNVILLSILFTIIDRVRRRLTVERPTRCIMEAATRMMQGDFTARVDLPRTYDTDDPFRSIAECFDRMAQELSHVETLRTDFISNVSHELKTPLAILQNYATILCSPDLTEQERLEYAESIIRTTKRLDTLISNILKLNKLENQQLTPALARYDLSEQVCTCLLAFVDVMEQKSIELQTDIEDDVHVTCDRELMDIVFNNLFSNAVKFTDAHGTITVSVQADERYATVSVRDSGCGISKEVGARIFDKFYQGDTSHATEGNGLGLSLVKRVIDMTGSDISVQSESGVGSVFTVHIKRSMV